MKRPNHQNFADGVSHRCARLLDVHYGRAIFSTVLLLMSVASGANGQLKTHPAVEISLPMYSYPKPFASLRDVDLKNSELVIFGVKVAPDFRAHLRHGSYEKLYKVGGDSVRFMWVKYIGNDTAEPSYGIAYYTWTAWAASSSDFGVVHLLHFEDGHLHVVQQIPFNLRGSEKAGAHLNAKSDTLTIRAVNDWEHCCPTGLDVVQFRLKDGELQKIHYGTAPLE